LFQNGDNPPELRLSRLPTVLEKSTVIASRPSALLIAATACAALASSYAHAQWWGRAPADFEECADKAEKAATREEKATALTGCNAKFAGRRKPGGGYTYFDFMQNRSFDIAGPNPTLQEQKHIDEQYTAYLDSQRRSDIAAAFSAKQQQLQQAAYESANEKQQHLQQAAYENANEKQQQLQQPAHDNPNAKAPAPRRSTPRPQAASPDARPRVRANTNANNCAEHSFSCDWPRLSEGIKDLKKALFGSPPGNAKGS
jgi:hypothetical protein